MVIAKKFVLSKRFHGLPKRTDLTLAEEELPPLKDGEFLIQAEFLSVNPCMSMKIFTDQWPEGSTMFGFQVSKIIESKNARFPVGKRVYAEAGWQTHVIINEKSSGIFGQCPYLLPDFGDLPTSLGLGILGMPGNTGYFGFTEICQPKAGETLVVSGAAGAIGSHVGQIGKILGLNVIGIAGSAAKCRWLKEELGFDHAINYRTENLAAALRKAAPNKVDCYFDNVGGEISVIVLSQMSMGGRVAVIGTISAYTEDFDALPKDTAILPIILANRLKVEGFHFMNYIDRWMEGIEQDLKWIKEGKLKYRETVTEGFENMFDAFVGMMKGENTGKAIVKV